MMRETRLLEAPDVGHRLHQHGQRQRALGPDGPAVVPEVEHLSGQRRLRRQQLVLGGMRPHPRDAIAATPSTTRSPCHRSGPPRGRKRYRHADPSTNR
jgi:hypothetical protein